MRTCLTLALFSLLIVGCTPDIPIKDAFEVTGQSPVGNIPPEFADFNNYNPQVALLLAEQLCVTPYELQVEKSLEAAPGQIAVARGRCETYAPPLNRLGEAASQPPPPQPVPAMTGGR
jgi:hypothetical protein